MARTTKNPKEQRIGFACDETDRRMLERLADDDGRSSSDVIRRLIRAAHTAKFGPEPPPAPTKKEKKRTARKP
jgi:Ribbon-helix-helix protein, copG family